MWKYSHFLKNLLNHLCIFGCSSECFTTCKLNQNKPCLHFYNTRNFIVLALKTTKHRSRVHQSLWLRVESVMSLMIGDGSGRPRDDHDCRTTQASSGRPPPGEGIWAERPQRVNKNHNPPWNGKHIVCALCTVPPPPGKHTSSLLLAASEKTHGVQRITNCLEYTHFFLIKDNTLPMLRSPYFFFFN